MLTSTTASGAQVTKAELISALEWFKDDAELHIVIPHPALVAVIEVYTLQDVRYRLQPSRIELVAGSGSNSSGNAA